MLLRGKGAELLEQVSGKVDEAKDKANDLASDAKKKGEGRKFLIYQIHFYFIFLFRS
jgi:hypothetical protein